MPELTVCRVLPEYRSRPIRRPIPWSTGVALALHGAIVGVVLRPVAPAAAVQPLLLPDTLVFPNSPPRVTPRHGQVARPPVGIPPIPPLSLPFIEVPDPWLQAPGGPSVAAVATGPAGPGGRGGGEPGFVPLVNEAPVLLVAPPPEYPRQLRESGIEGAVVLRLMVDTLGRPEPGTIRVVHSDHPGLAEPAARSLRLARFRPARSNGRAVRVLVEVPVRFQLGR